jgi:hypothetical protein
MHKGINGFFVKHNAAMFKAANNFSFWVDDTVYTTLDTFVLNFWHQSFTFKF